MPTIAPTSSATNSTGSGATAAALPSPTLSQNDFLKLLVAQMTSQDPMNPTSDTQMAAQLAQFTSLQQSGTMSNNIATMMSQQQLLAANGMLGKNVMLQVDPSHTTTGVVQSVQMQGSNPQIVVNGMAYDLSQVLTISPAGSGN